ncbi:MAG TPA: allophanate hydrolase [Rhizomicrobium sp.]|jgi:allophanate hydrolase
MRLSIGDLLARYREGTTAPAQVLHDVLARADACPDPGVWIARVPDADIASRAQKLASDPSAKTLPLYGVPFAVKDNIDVAGMPTTAGCPAFAYTPAKNAAVVDRLLAAGAILVGKTNLDQFATGLVGTRSPYGAPRCVFDMDYVSGGSSSGSAVAVARGLAAFALGTDTAGSGRVPAAFNRLVGVKPSRGLLSNTGLVPACRSLDCISIFADDLAGASAVLDVAAGYDETDPYSRVAAPVSLPQNFRFGVLAGQDRIFFGETGNEKLYDDAIARLAARGGTPVVFDYAPFREAAALLYQGPWVAERYAAIRSFYQDHASDMDPTVRAIIAGAEHFSAIDLFEGQYKLAALKRQSEAAWDTMDVMLLPTAPAQYKVADVNADPVALNARMGTYTNFVNLLDLSALAIPAGFRDDGLAFGVTLIAPAFTDHALLQLALRLEME